MQSARIILLLVLLTAILDSDFLLLVDRWLLHLVVDIGIQIELDSPINEVLLGPLIVLDLVVVDHVPKQRRLLMPTQQVALRNIPLVLRSLHLWLHLLLIVIRLSMLLLQVLFLV